MSRALQATPDAQVAPQESEEDFVWPEYAPSPAHRSFLERLKRARIERGLSIEGMSDEVGLTFRLAHEFEDGVTPLPFEWLEVWCQVVGVPFADYLAIYWADEREWAERKAGEREAERTAETPCITNTEAPTPAFTETPAPALSLSLRAFGFLNILRSVAAHIRDRLLSLFHIPKKKPE